jgi:hypothetical protein
MVIKHMAAFVQHCGWNQKMTMAPGNWIWDGFSNARNCRSGIFNVEYPLAKVSLCGI